METERTERVEQTSDGASSRRQSNREARWAERRAIIERYERSGESAEEFCKGAGLSYYAFSKWRSRLRGEELQRAQGEANGVFKEVPKQSTRADQRTAQGSIIPLTITLPNHIQVEIPYRLSELPEILQVLSRC
jgi:hypothetical protein